MASKVSPSSRLVFCLLISAAVLRPGKLLVSGKPHRSCCCGPGAVPRVAWGCAL